MTALPTIVSITEASDIAGIYTVYTYSDGHTDTNPPYRPFSKEDLQRQIRDQLAQTLATQSLANEQARYTSQAVQQGAPNAQSIARAEFDVINGNLVLQPFPDAIANFSQFAPTATALPGPIQQLVSSVSLGGYLVGGDANTVEYVPPEVLATSSQNQIQANPNYAAPSYPLQLQRAAQ
jgi:hypothetical protein